MRKGRASTPCPHGPEHSSIRAIQKKPGPKARSEPQVKELRLIAVGARRAAYDIRLPGRCPGWAALHRSRRGCARCGAAGAGRRNTWASRRRGDAATVGRGWTFARALALSRRAGRAARSRRGGRLRRGGVRVRRSRAPRNAGLRVSDPGRGYQCGSNRCGECLGWVHAEISCVRCDNSRTAVRVRGRLKKQTRHWIVALFPPNAM